MTVCMTTKISQTAEPTVLRPLWKVIGLIRQRKLDTTLTEKKPPPQQFLLQNIKISFLEGRDLLRLEAQLLL